MGATGQTGTFPGHAIPAAFFFGFGTFFLLLSLRRARSLPPGRSFCDAHVPERNATLVRKLSLVLISCTAAGFFYEGLGGCLASDMAEDPPGCFFHQSTHETLYLSFCFVGVVMLLESLNRLPPDSSRCALALALLLEYILWNEHALMKEDGTDNRVHVIMAQICLVSSAIFAFSVYRPSNLVAYIAGWATLVLQSLWLITAGINADFREIHRHLIGAFLCLEILLVASLILLAATCCGTSVAQKEGRLNGVGGFSRGVGTSVMSNPSVKEYESLHITDDDEEEDSAPAVV